MNILITGGAGFIGSHLAKKYTEGNNHVYIIDNLITGNKQNLTSLAIDKFTLIQEDILTYNFINLPQIDILYHLASPASPIQYKKYPVETLRVNSEGTYKVLEFCRTGTVGRMVLASTSEIYGDPLEHPQKETYWGNVNSTGDRACYDEGKRYAEAITMTYHRKFDIDVRIARIFNTYGPNMEKNDGRVISNFITQALQNLPITVYGKGEQTRCFCYVSDMVSGLISLGETENIEGEIINLGNSDEKTILELAEIIQEMTDTKSEIIYEAIGKDDPKKRKPDISKAKSLLSWSTKVGLSDGLTRTIDYFSKFC